MVDPWLLSLDASSNVVSLLVPAGVWALLFFLAWEHPAFAESIGLGRRAFWLLLPGALLSSYAFLPLAPISNDWVAVSFGGALFPLAVGAFALRRSAPPARRTLARFVGYTAAEAGAMLVVVLPAAAPTLARIGRATGLGAPGTAVLLVGIVGLAVCAFAALVDRGSPDRIAPRGGFLLGLSTGVMLLTFAGSSAIPGVGIVESYPYYLLPPIAAGIAAGLLAPRFFSGEEGFALPSALLAGTVGVLIGADLLREPPLYGSGAGGLYVVGGAGVLDLVYLSGLLALAGALLVHVGQGRGWAPIGAPLPAPAPSPVRHLQEAYRAGVAGDLAGSMRSSVAAARSAATQARTLLGAPPGTEERPWQGLAVPGWLVSDHANLARVAGSGTADPREGYRAWLTARWLVLAGRQLALRRFASIGERSAAFAIDLAVVTLPALLLFGAIVRTTRGGFDAVALSLPFNTAIVGTIAVALLYFTVTEAYTGTTLGKAAIGIAVRDRTLGRPDGLSALVRNLPLAPILSLVAIGGAVALAVAEKGAGAGTTSILGVEIPGGLFAGAGIFAVVVGGVALLGSFGVLAIALTLERQRIGDLWAGTWVVRAGGEPTSPAVPAPASPVPAATPPPAEGVRSG
ncbi:MAG TPA: RDD family protein [Thermoplasmata archaeon]|nr:RDD family protein [Thermoplasmata archaeon]